MYGLKGRWREWFTEGAGLFLWTAAFFYTHAGFVVLSLVPASFRAVQMWRELNTPMWMEIVVELSRVVLLALILARLEKLPFVCCCARRSGTISGHGVPHISAAIGPMSCSRRLRDFFFSCTA